MNNIILKNINDTKNIINKYIIPIINNNNNNIVICLNGPVGSGKTFISKNIISNFNFPIETITSPTYCIMNEYKNLNNIIYHIDMYRLKKNDTYILNNLNFFSILDSENIIIIEWPIKQINYYVQNYSKKCLLEINLSFNKSNHREFNMEVIGNK